MKKVQPMRKENKFQNLLQDNEEVVDLILSYSRISSFDREGGKVLQVRKITSNDGMKNGKLVDTLLFDRESFKELYHISEFEKPTSSLGDLCDIIYNNYESIPDKEKVLEIIKLNNLWSNIVNPDLLLKKLSDEFWGYLKQCYECNNKTLITLNEKLLAEDIVSIIKTHEYTKDLLYNEELEYIYQHEFITNIDKFRVRGIIDIISIDHKNKKIYFKDLKTGSKNSSEFIKSYIDYRYYLQGGVYQLAYKDVIKQLKLEEYKLQPFEFIYISLKEKIPISFIMTDKWYQAALFGFKISNHKFRGLYELLDEIYFHWKHNLYQLTKEMYENNGRIELKDDFITLNNL